MMQRDDSGDTQLIHRIATGDHHAFERLYYRYASPIMTFITRYSIPPDLHEEVVNDVMIVIWQRATDFRATSRPSTWIYGIARRKALAAYRQIRKFPACPVSTLPTEFDQEAPTDIAIEAEHLDIIRKALEKLPPNQRTALTLAFYYNYSQREIANRTGYSASTIKSQLRQGLHRMRATLKRLERVSIC